LILGVWLDLLFQIAFHESEKSAPVEDNDKQEQAEFNTDIFDIVPEKKGTGKYQHLDI